MIKAPSLKFVRTIFLSCGMAFTILLLNGSFSFAQVSDVSELHIAEGRSEVSLWILQDRKIVLNREPVHYSSEAQLQNILVTRLSGERQIELKIQAHCYAPADLIEDIENILFNLSFNRNQNSENFQEKTDERGFSTYRIEQQCSQLQQTFTDTHREILHSDVINQDFAIFISLPKEYETSSVAYPLVYFTDANIFNDQLRGIAAKLRSSGEIPPLILVGIGYRETDQIGRLRLRDLTSSDAAMSRPSGLPIGFSMGGAENFLNFIEQSLKPHIYSNYRAIETDETFMGHSLGGLFGASALFNHSDSFDRFVLVSTTSDLNPDTLFLNEQMYRETHSDLPKNIYLGVGALEGQAQISHTLRIYNTLLERNYPGLAITHREIPGSDHGWAWLPAYRDGLIAVFSTEIGSR